MAICCLTEPETIKMTTNWIVGMIILATVGSGLMSGLFFTFSNFAMQAFGELPPNYGSAAMQSVNVRIINPQFLTVFLGTAIISLISVVFAGLNWEQPGSAWILAGGLLYLGGCMFITIRFNIPLNDQLATLDPEGPGIIPRWQAYAASWLPWNHVRTFSTLAATAAFAVSLTKFNPCS